MSDAILNHSNKLYGPAWDAASVTAADADLARKPATALWVGGAGDVSVVMAGGGVVTIAGVAAGTLLPIRVDRVAAATTATSIVALYAD